MNAGEISRAGFRDSGGRKSPPLTKTRTHAHTHTHTAPTKAAGGRLKGQQLEKPTHTAYVVTGGAKGYRFSFGRFGVELAAQGIVGRAQGRGHCGAKDLATLSESGAEVMPDVRLSAGLVSWPAFR